MKNRHSTHRRLTPLALAGFLLMNALPGHAEDKTWLPDSGVKSPYSPLAIPTKLEPVEESLTDLLNQGYATESINGYPSGQLFVLKKRIHHLLCVLNGPPAKANAVPTSRCWRLN